MKSLSTKYLLKRNDTALIFVLYILFGKRNHLLIKTLLLEFHFVIHCFKTRLVFFTISSYFLLSVTICIKYGSTNLISLCQLMHNFVGDLWCYDYYSLYFGHGLMPLCITWETKFLYWFKQKSLSKEDDVCSVFTYLMYVWASHCDFSQYSWGLVLTYVIICLCLCQMYSCLTWLGMSLLSINDGVQPKTPPFSTRHIIWVNYKVVNQLFQPILLSF